MDPAGASAFWSGVTGSLIAGVGTGFGALPIFLRRRWGERGQTLMLAVAAGIMLAATLFSLILPALELGAARSGSALAAAAVAAAGVLLGGAAIWGFHSLAPHGHGVERREGEPKPWSRYWLFVLAITLHNFPEGLSVGVAWGAGRDEGLSITVGILLQNLPEGLAVAAALIAAGYSRLRAFAVSFGTGLVEPVGGIVGAAAVALLPWALAFAAGAMLFVVAGEIIPETHRGGRERLSTFSLAAGFCLMMLVDAAVG